MDPPRKKNKTIHSTNDILGIYTIFVSCYVPYEVCVANQEKITKKFIKFLMGNNVEFAKKSLEEAIDYLFERDHGYFQNIKVGKFGPRFVPFVFFTQVPDVLVPEEFQQ